MAKKTQSLRDDIQTKISQWSEAGTNKYISSVRPIYISTVNENPMHIATGTLLHVAEKKYLVTAAHVIDKNAKSCLYIAGEKELVMLEGNAHVTTKPNDDRNCDHFDFGWIELSDDMLVKLGNVKYADVQSDISGYKEEQTSLYLVLGYPNTKNRKIDNKKKSIRPRYFRFTSINKEIPELSHKLNVSNRSHIFLDYNSKYSTSFDGKKINSLKPKGISGGPLIYIGNIREIENNTEDAEMDCRLSGILVEHHKPYNAISSVKMKVIIDRIISACP